MHEFEEVDSRTFFHKIIQWFVDGGFGNLWQLAIDRIYEISKIILCNFRQVNLGATKKKKNLKVMISTFWASLKNDYNFSFKTIKLVRHIELMKKINYFWKINKFYKIIKIIGQ